MKKSGSRPILYARCSTKQQDTADQLDTLQKAALLRGFHPKETLLLNEEGFSGKNMARPKLQDAFKKLRLREYDTLIVTRMDRLGRSLSDIIKIMERAREEQWSLVILNFFDGQELDTRSATGNLLYMIVAAFAQFERELTVERTLAAFAAKRERGDPGFYSIAMEDEVASRYYKKNRRTGRWEKTGVSMFKIAKTLQRTKVPTAAGGRWNQATIKKLLDRWRARQNAA